MKASVLLALLAASLATALKQKAADNGQYNNNNQGKQIPPPPTGAYINTNVGSKDIWVPQGAGQPLSQNQAYPNPEVKVYGVDKQGQLKANAPLEAGQKAVIEWSKTEGVSNVVVDMVNECGYMNAPHTIATPSAKDGKLEVEIPTWCKNADCYKFRVWSVNQPLKGDPRGQSQPIHINNNVAGAPQNFVVKAPNKITLDNPAQIKWDYSPYANTPALVDINLCRDGKVVRNIARGVKAEDKGYTWNVPSDQDLCDDGNYYFQVTDGHHRDGQQDDHGADSEPVVIAELGPAGSSDEERAEEVNEVTTVTVDETVTQNAAVAASAVKDLRLIGVAGACLLVAMLF